MSVYRRAGLVAVAALIAAGCGGGGGSAAAKGRFDQQRAMRDLKAQLGFGPRPAGTAENERQARWIAGRLRDAGARGVRIQQPWRNVVGHLPGRKPGVIVVGAHHDTKDIPGFLGANDGASGVAVVLELARSLPRRPSGPSIHFVLFDAEEARDDRDFALDGTRGSRQYVSYARAARQGSPRLGSIRAMVLFDLVGDCDLHIPREALSDPGLYARFKGAAFGGETGAILDDHVPFREAGVPTVDLIDFDFGPGPTPGAWWHTTEDTLGKVCASSLGQVGGPALRALRELG